MAEVGPQIKGWLSTTLKQSILNGFDRIRQMVRFEFAFVN
jgi:hypothetical protein